MEGMTTTTVEERLTALEQEIAQLKAQKNGERYGVTGRTNPQVLEELFGVFADNSHAEEVLRSIEAEREKERQEAQHSSENPVSEDSTEGAAR